MWQVLFSLVPDGKPDHWAGRRSSTVPGISAQETTGICRFCMLSCWPGDLRSLSLLRKKHLRLATAANEFFLGGKHWLHLWTPRRLGKAQATQSLLRFFSLKLRMRPKEVSEAEKSTCCRGIHRWWGQPSAPRASQHSSQLLTLLYGIYSSEGSVTLDSHQCSSQRALWPSNLLWWEGAGALRTGRFPRPLSSVWRFLGRKVKDQLWWGDRFSSGQSCWGTGADVTAQEAWKECSLTPAMECERHSLAPAGNTCPMPAGRGHLIMDF